MTGFRLHPHASNSLPLDHQQLVFNFSPCMVILVVIFIQLDHRQLVCDFSAHMAILATVFVQPGLVNKMDHLVNYHGCLEGQVLLQKGPCLFPHLGSPPQFQALDARPWQFLPLRVKPRGFTISPSSSSDRTGLPMKSSSSLPATDGGMLPGFLASLS